MTVYQQLKEFVRVNVTICSEKTYIALFTPFDEYPWIHLSFKEPQSSSYCCIWPTHCLDCSPFVSDESFSMQAAQPLEGQQSDAGFKTTRLAAFCIGYQWVTLPSRKQNKKTAGLISKPAIGEIMCEDLLTGDGGRKEKAVHFSTWPWRGIAIL